MLDMEQRNERAVLYSAKVDRRYARMRSRINRAVCNMLTFGLSLLVIAVAVLIIAEMWWL